MQGSSECAPLFRREQQTGGFPSHGMEVPLQKLLLSWAPPPHPVASAQLPPGLCFAPNVILTQHLRLSLLLKHVTFFLLNSSSF